MTIKDQIEANWNSTKALHAFLGQNSPFPEGSHSWNFGEVPTEKALVVTKEGKIATIKTYSGLRWSAKGGYGSPYCYVTNDL